jgi:hypothetical protein
MPRSLSLLLWSDSFHLNPGWRFHSSVLKTKTPISVFIRRLVLNLRRPRELNSPSENTVTKSSCKQVFSSLVPCVIKDVVETDVRRTLELMAGQVFPNFK